MLKENYNGIIVPTEVYMFLKRVYDSDGEVMLQKDPNCESWKTGMKERYIFRPEKVRVLVMVPNEE